MVYGCEFQYDGVSSKEYHLTMCNTENSSMEDADMGLNLDILYDASSAPLRYEYSVKYNETISFLMMVVKDNYSYFTRNEVRDISKWLTGRKTAAWLTIIDTGYDDINYLCRVTGIQARKIASETYALLLTWTSASPYAYSNEETYTYHITQKNQEIHIYCDSDDINDYVYPYLTIETLNNATDTISIVNKNDNDRLTRIRGLTKYEIITLDNQKGIINTNIHSKRMLPLFETRKWFRLLSGENVIVVNGNCKITVSFRCPRKVGEF